jgi:hypothetical protein
MWPLRQLFVGYLYLPHLKTGRQSIEWEFHLGESILEELDFQSATKWVKMAHRAE